MGASAVKILVYYRLDLQDLARKQLNTVDNVAEECIKYDLPFLAEPISYPTGSEISSPEEFAGRKAEQVEIACRAGASGFLGGRAIWQEVMGIEDAEDRVKFLSTIGADRLKRLTEIATRYAVPWYKKYGVTAQELARIPEGWYQEY